MAEWLSCGVVSVVGLGSVGPVGPPVLGLGVGPVVGGLGVVVQLDGV